MRKGWSLGGERIGMSVDRGAGIGGSGRSSPRGSKYDPGVVLGGFGVLGPVHLYHAPTINNHVLRPLLKCYAIILVWFSANVHVFFYLFQTG